MLAVFIQGGDDCGRENDMSLQNKCLISNDRKYFPIFWTFRNKNATAFPTIDI